MRWMNVALEPAAPVIEPPFDSTVPVALVPWSTWIENSPLGENWIVAASAATSAAEPLTSIAPS